MWNPWSFCKKCGSFPKHPIYARWLRHLTYFIVWGQIRTIYCMMYSASHWPYIWKYLWLYLLTCPPWFNWRLETPFLIVEIMYFVVNKYGHGWLPLGGMSSTWRDYTPCSCRFSGGMYKRNLLHSKADAIIIVLLLSLGNTSKNMNYRGLFPSSLKMLKCFVSMLFSPCFSLTFYTFHFSLYFLTRDIIKNLFLYHV